MSNVAIVIVSHSAKVAEGAADMVRQMVGDEVPLAWTGGDPEGGLGTSVQAIIDAVTSVHGSAGCAVLVDLGGAETNAEMAIELLPEELRATTVVLQSPVVEGAVIAGTESASGGTLDAVKAAAEELSP